MLSTKVQPSTPQGYGHEPSLSVDASSMPSFRIPVCTPTVVMVGVHPRPPDERERGTAGDRNRRGNATQRPSLGRASQPQGWEYGQDGQGHDEVADLQHRMRWGPEDMTTTNPSECPLPDRPHRQNEQGPRAARPERRCCRRPQDTAHSDPEGTVAAQQAATGADRPTLMHCEPGAALPSIPTTQPEPRHTAHSGGRTRSR